MKGCTPALHAPQAKCKRRVSLKHKRSTRPVQERRRDSQQIAHPSPLQTTKNKSHSLSAKTSVRPPAPAVGRKTTASGIRPRRAANCDGWPAGASLALRPAARGLACSSSHGCSRARSARSSATAQIAKRATQIDSPALRSGLANCGGRPARRSKTRAPTLTRPAQVQERPSSTLTATDSLASGRAAERSLTATDSLAARRKCSPPPPHRNGFGIGVHRLCLHGVARCARFPAPAELCRRRAGNGAEQRSLTLREADTRKENSLLDCSLHEPLPRRSPQRTR